MCWLWSTEQKEAPGQPLLSGRCNKLAGGLFDETGSGPQADGTHLRSELREHSPGKSAFPLEDVGLTSRPQPPACRRLRVTHTQVTRTRVTHTASWTVSLFFLSHPVFE